MEKIAAIRPGTPAARSGLRAGEILDVRPMPWAQRYRLNSEMNAGESIRVYVVRGGSEAPIVMRSQRYGAFTWDVVVAIVGMAWMVLFAAILALRAPERAEARVLALLLLAIVLQQALAPNDWVTPWPALDAVAAALSWVSSLGLVLLVTYSLAFARPVSRLRLALSRLAYAVALLSAGAAVAEIIARCMGLEFLSRVIKADAIATLFISLPCLFPLLVGIATTYETRGVERTRYLWAFVPLGLYYLAVLVYGAVEALQPALYTSGIDWYLNAAGNVTAFLAPLGLTYSLLNRRLLDIGFVLNRAAVFTGVSIVIVGAFVLVEWAISDWMQRTSHSTNIIVSGALALGLGLSIRFVHARVEHVVDNVMFRKRREDEEAIRRMAREAPYITERETLLERVEQTLTRHADASVVNVLLDDGRGRYGVVNENDPALVSLRADHVRVDLHASDTAIEGEWAYPMVARGRLVGALLLGPKQSQESYAPDESAAIAALAHSVAGALDVLSMQTPADALAEIRTSLAAVADAVAAQGELLRSMAAQTGAMR